MSQQSNEPVAAIASLNSRIEIMENFYNEMSKNLTSILEITRQNHSNGLMCECRLENRSHEISTRSVLNDLWTRQKLLEERVQISEEKLINEDSKVNAFRDLTANHISQLDKEMQETQSDYQREFQATNHLIEHAETGIEKCFERIEGLEKDNGLSVYHIAQCQEGIEKCFERIEKLELWKEAAIEKNIQDVERMKKIEHSNKHHAKCILSLDENQKSNEGNLFERIKKFEKQIDNWEEEFYFLQDKLRSSDKKPYKCPSCSGFGNFKLQDSPILRIATKCILECKICKSQETRCDHCKEIVNYIQEIEKCKSCEGKGIVWG